MKLEFLSGSQGEKRHDPLSFFNFSDSWLIYFPFISGRSRGVYTNSAPSSKVDGSNIACIVKIIASLIFANWIVVFIYVVSFYYLFICLFIYLYHGARAPVGQGLLIVEDSWSHSDTPQSVGLLWKSDQADAETSTWQHTTLTRDRHPYPRRNSNPQFYQASGRRPTP